MLPGAYHLPVPHQPPPSAAAASSLLRLARPNGSGSSLLLTRALRVCSSVPPLRNRCRGAGSNRASRKLLPRRRASARRSRQRRRTPCFSAGRHFLTAHRAVRRSSRCAEKLRRPAGTTTCRSGADGCKLPAQRAGSATDICDVTYCCSRACRAREPARCARSPLPSDRLYLSRRVRGVFVRSSASREAPRRA